MRKVLLGLVVLSSLVLVGCAGPVGPSGSDGAQGVQGPSGPAGATGPAGIDGTSISIVKLCHACTTHYPDMFAEVALCFGNTLYGTYSANGGFSAQLPNGAYNSNGINCSCTVTITGCSVN